MPPKKAPAAPVKPSKRAVGGARPAKNAVEAEVAPAPTAEMTETVAAALLAEDRATALKAYRVALAAGIVAAKPAELPALVRESRSVLGELDALAPKGQSTVDGIRQRSGARRAARRADAQATTRRSQPRRTAGTHRNGAT
jgi:hypothetical protein